MSYDLFLIRTSPSLRRQEFESYFQNRPHYTLNENKNQAWYENDTTGVYFSFDFEKDGYFPESERELEEESNTSSGMFNKLKLLFKEPKIGAPYILFNINYNRPSIFAREAAIELAQITRDLNLNIDDPQLDGIEGNRYDSNAFIQAWSISNHQAESNIPQAFEQRIKLPAQSVLQNWEWNYYRDALCEKLAAEWNKYVFVPKISIYTDGETNFQGCTWPDGIPVYLPKHIDKVIIYRDTLLPDDLKEKGQSPNITIMDLHELEPLLKRYDCAEFEDAYCLDYQECPEELAAAVKAMPSEPINLELVSWDMVLEIGNSVPN